MTGKLDMGPKGPTKLALEQDGIDFAAVSLQPIPAGEYVPLLFTARNLSLETNSAGELRGMYDVPSYRGATFMDPKVCLSLFEVFWRSSIRRACLRQRRAPAPRVVTGLELDKQLPAAPCTASTRAT
jgi:hypothetical protein